jgi:Mn-dependent DtxR family transcriptional regulator
LRSNESAEDYLEAILMIKNEKGYVRSIDVAHALSFTKPSVSVAMKSLREKGYITFDDSAHISLTETGYALASKVYERHVVISKALISLGVDEKTALIDSCKIEHDLSDMSFLKLKEFLIKKNII